LYTDTLATPVGELFIACNATALCVVDFSDFSDRMRVLLSRRFGSFQLLPERDPLGVTTRLARYFAGELAACDALPVESGGTAFQRRVWDELRKIPAGRTCTYGQLAAQLGSTHARAVGHANALNPIAIVVPCHRVIGSNAALTGYAGGLHRKRWLLDHEARAVTLRLPL
jgi:methylated-DNA-[protein]-cysteine S-methyltransferase